MRGKRHRRSRSCRARGRILGIDLDLLFDPAVVEVSSVSAAGVGTGMTLISNVPEPGMLEIALFGLTRSPAAATWSGSCSGPSARPAPSRL